MSTLNVSCWQNDQGSVEEDPVALLLASRAAAQPPQVWSECCSSPSSSRHHPSLRSVLPSLPEKCSVSRLTLLGGIQASVCLFFGGLSPKKCLKLTFILFYFLVVVLTVSLCSVNRGNPLFARVTVEPSHTPLKLHIFKFLTKSTHTFVPVTFPEHGLPTAQ